MAGIKHSVRILSQRYLCQFLVVMQLCVMVYACQDRSYLFCQYGDDKITFGLMYAKHSTEFNLLFIWHPLEYWNFFCICADEIICGHICLALAVAADGGRCYCYICMNNGRQLCSSAHWSGVTKSKPYNGQMHTGGRRIVKFPPIEREVVRRSDCVR